MLRELYDYALRENLILPPGFVRKPVRAYISLTIDGKYVGIIVSDGEKVPCPDIGSMANSSGKCNVLAEKRSILFPGDEKQREKYAAKAAYFHEAMAEAAKAEPRLELCLNAMCDADVASAISAELDQLRIDGTKVLSFTIDGESILELPAVRSWWEQFRQQFLPSGSRSPCLITGKLTVPTATVPPVSGLSVVGGHARGDALICFDKDAFCSYGLKQAANAPVSEEAFAGVKAALDELLKDAPVVAGMKFVHWYDKPIPAEDDCIGTLFPSLLEAEDDEEEAELEPDVNRDQARRQADEVISTITSGKSTHELPNLYYILLLSGVSGRVMVRSYEEGSYQTLVENLQQWETDLRLANSFGTAELKPAKLTARLIRLLSRQNSDKNIFERMSKELAGLTPAIINAIINGTQFPDAVASRALAYIRSQMFSSGEEEQSRKVPDPWACQWLKAWLCRREREKYQKEELSMEYNEKHPDPAYHCGALVAVYGEIQSRAMPDVNASLIDRYYASAVQTPALVLGQLSKLSNYHISKIDNPWLKKELSELRGQAACAIGDCIPAVLRPEQQSYFALGYYQMCAKINKERLARIAAAAGKKSD